MKQKILYIILMITAFLGRGEMVFGQELYYVCNIPTEREWSTNNNSGNYDISYPAKTLTFEAKRTAILGFTNSDEFYAQYSTDGGNNWTNVSSLNLPKKDTWYSFSYEIPINSNCVRFITKAGATGKKQICNVKVTRATTLTPTPTSISLGDVQLGETRQGTISVSWNNTYHGRTLSISDDDATNALSLTGIENAPIDMIDMKDLGSTSFNYTFVATALGPYSKNIKLSRNDGEVVEIPVTANVVVKYTPELSLKQASLNINTERSLTDIVSSTSPCEFKEIMVHHDDSRMATIVGGKLFVYSNIGTVRLLVSQYGNEKWTEVNSQELRLQIVKPEKHLPLEITESNWSILARNIQGGSFAWDGGIQHHSLAYGNREFEIAFQGIPDKLTFDHRVTDSNIDNEVKWTVYEGPDGSNFTEAWSTGTNNGSASIQLKPTTRYVRIKCYCIYYENVSNIQISELRYLTSTASSIDFGENVEGETVSKTFTVKHANAGYGVTLTSSNPDVFEVSPALLTATGGDKMGEETITVTYKNNTVGSHSGTITIADPSGSNADITLNVAGSTLSNTLFLNPAETPNYDVRTYKRIVLQRTLPMGYSTITLPFTCDIDNVEGGAFVAQLELVTHNQQDCYTLYFRKVADGVMQPNQPYVLYMPFENTNAEWGETAISSPEAQSIVKNGWIMQGNYTPNTPMNGNFGIAKGLLCKGEGGDAKINAYTAYFIPPTHSHGTKNVRARVAVMDEGGNTTYIGELSDLNGNAAEEVFGIDGMRLPEMRKGINIVRQKDGSVRKIVK